MSKRVIQIGAGSYSQTEFQGGLLGGAEYARANIESDKVRFGDRPFGASQRGGDVMYSESNPAPPKPAAVALSGYDLFGPETLGSTTRNMMLDIRGEVVSAAQASKSVPPPAGGGYSSNKGVVAEKPLSSTMKATAGSKGAAGRGSKPYGIGQKVDYSQMAEQVRPQEYTAPQMPMSRAHMYPAQMKAAPKKNHVLAAVHGVGRWTKSVRLPWMKKH